MELECELTNELAVINIKNDFVLIEAKNGSHQVELECELTNERAVINIENALVLEEVKNGRVLLPFLVI